MTRPAPASDCRATYASAGKINFVAATFPKRTAFLAVAFMILSTTSAFAQTDVGATVVATTAPPTTAPPTTAPPTTAAPTTAPATTEPPATIAPTTVPAPTVAPTTVALTQPPQSVPVVTVVSPTTRAATPTTVRPVPKPILAKANGSRPKVVPSGPTSIEVDISSQRLMLYKNGALLRSIHVSTGSNRRYCEKGSCGNAHTPRGRFRIYNRIGGWRTSRLGRLFNPLYFTGGFAIHGAGSVPNYPASHGCVRVTIATAIWLPGVVPNGTPVWVHD